MPLRISGLCLVGRCWLGWGRTGDSQCPDRCIRWPPAWTPSCARCCWGLWRWPPAEEWALATDWLGSQHMQCRPRTERRSSACTSPYPESAAPEEGKKPYKESHKSTRIHLMSVYLCIFTDHGTKEGRTTRPYRVDVHLLYCLGIELDLWDTPTSFFGLYEVCEQGL